MSLSEKDFYYKPAATGEQVGCLDRWARKHRYRTYTLTGPKLMSLPEMAEELSSTIGHHVRYVDLPGPGFGALLRLGGSDSFTANGLVAQFREIVRPDEEGIDVSQDVEMITGRPPTTFKQFVVRHKSRFQGRDMLPYLQMCIGGVTIAGAAVLIKFDQ